MLKISLLNCFAVCKSAALKQVLALIFAVVCCVPAFAYGVATIGTAASTSSLSGPTTSTTSGARTERHTVIYTASELATAGVVGNSMLFSIAWDKSGVGAYTGNDLTIRVWLKHNSSTTFSSNPSFATETGSATLVYETTTGTIPATTGYLRFIFNQNTFTWNGSDNIQVITEIIRPASYTNTTFSWRTIATTTNAAANSGAAAAVDALTRTSTRPLVQFEIATPGADGALLSMTSPVSSPAGPQLITVVLRNTGNTPLTTANINYSINGAAPIVYAWAGLLDIGASTSVTLGSSNFANGYYTIVANVVTVNGAGDNDPSNSTVTKSFQVCSPLSGTYTVNNTAATGGTVFHSFNDLAASLTSCGVSGPVTINVISNPAPYNEQVIFQNIVGVGAGAPITINGNGATITSDTAIIQTGSNPNRHIIRLIDQQYFTINNLKINMVAGSTGFIGIHVLNSGSHITISNCVVDMGTATSTLLGAFIVNGDPAGNLTPGGTFDNITITGSKAMGGGYAVSVDGLASPLATNVVISNNEFTDSHSNGVYLRETDGAIVSDNKIDKASANVTSWNAIQVAQAANINTKIFNNFIKVSQTANGTQQIRGIYLFNGTGHKVYNNVISNVQLTTGNFTAIEVRTGATAPEISFNTINLDNEVATVGTLYGIKEELSNTNAVLRNNIVSITQATSGVKAALSLATGSTLGSAFNSNYNILWVPGGNVAVRNTTTPTFYPTLASWTSASTQDANSREVDPLFTSPTLAKPTNAAADDAGISLAGITTDIVGVPRASPPDAGAYEFSIAAPVIYTFTGNGNWNVAANWLNNLMPSSPLAAGSEIIINPSGTCELNIPFTIQPGGKITVKTGKAFNVHGNLSIQ
jgi:hypothetical protein